jgi:hypothetical protein
MLRALKDWFGGKRSSRAGGKHSARPARRVRLELEALEDRTVPTVVFAPQYGAEQVIPSPSGSFTTLSNAPVYLIFWGQQWNSAFEPGAPPVLNPT